MDEIKIVEIKEDILSRNGVEAQKLREEMLDRKVFFLNLMSSPGAGKTTLLTDLIGRLKEDYRIGVIEADIDSAVDAETIRARTGIDALQMHTGGTCHITGQMAQEAVDGLGVDDLDVVFLENIGNLVCPAEFDTGAAVNLVLLSVPEGDDKPLKYPLMFEKADAVVITKEDAAEAFDFSPERVRENIRLRNAQAPVFFVSALNGTGMDKVEDYVRSEIEKVRS